MPERVCVVFPWRGGCEYRERAFAWLRAAYPGQIPDWQLVTATAPPGAWVKAAAVMPAIEASKADIIVMSDADVWAGSEAIQAAVAAVIDGAPWARPHRLVRRLNESATTALIETGEAGKGLARRPYGGLWGGGVVVAPRETLLDVPLDPRFIGWGQEDEAWAVALRLLAGMPWQGDADLLHLWHPPQERFSRRRGSHAGMELRNRYVRARSDPVQMRALVEEAKRERKPADQQALHPEAALAER